MSPLAVTRSLAPDELLLVVHGVGKLCCQKNFLDLTTTRFNTYQISYSVRKERHCGLDRTR